jgi:putative cardiolipin synthase
LLALAVVGGCASSPPGSRYPKVHSVALAEPDTTRLGRQFAQASAEHSGRSGFRIFNVGVDGFLLRLEMINAAERTLDLEYYIFRGDESGRLLTDALARAADRGVRVRVLVDDADTLAGDEQILALSGHAEIEIRVFNPWAYRGHSKILRDAEFIARRSRLDYRMHNKMLAADGAVALVGGRNVGDQYFQTDPQSQFADDDVFVGGPITADVSAKFDEYWNSPLAIPAAALAHRSSQPAAPGSPTTARTAPKVRTVGFNYTQKLATGEPLAGVLAGQLPLVWAEAQFLCDPPDKKSAVAGSRVGALIYKPVAQLATQAHSELIVVTPYLVPSKDELRLVEGRRREGVRVGILTNSLESTPDEAAHAGYTHYRVPFLQEGVQLYEVRSLLGNNRGSGQSGRISRYGNYALHAKLYVFDRKQLFIGSMNFDARSGRLNTEMGLIIDSAELAQQEAGRFEAMTRPENAYSVALRPGSEQSPRLVWRTSEGGKPVEYDSEPVRSPWQRVKVKFLALLPLDSEL